MYFDYEDGKLGIAKVENCENKNFKQVKIYSEMPIISILLNVVWLIITAFAIAFSIKIFLKF